MAARISSISLYSKIVRENFEDLDSIEAQIRSFESRFTRARTSNEMAAIESEIEQLQHSLAMRVSIVIVFAAITAEAYIYDYAVRHLSDEFTQQHLDKIDTISKWLIIPRLVTGRSLSEGGKWITLLRAVIKERNSIIHSKSKEIPFNFEKQQELFKRRVRRLNCSIC